MLPCFLVLNAMCLRDDGGLEKPQQQNSQKQTPKNPQKPFLEFFKTTYMEFLLFADLSAKGHSNSKPLSSLQNWPSPKPDQLTQVLFQATAAEDVVVPPQAAPSPLSPRLGTVHIAQQWEGRVAPSGGASLAQVVAKARVVCACVIVRMTV